jgi:hypothetical protein
MDTTRISRKTLELTFKAKRPLGRTRVRCLRQVLEDIKNREKKKKEIEKEGLNERLEIRINDKEERKEEEKEDMGAVLCLLLK